MLKGYKKFLMLFMLLILPFLIIYLSGLNEWIGRLIAALFFFITINISIIIYCTNPKTKFVTDNAKLALPGYEKAKKIVENAARILGIALSIGLFLIFTLPLIIDTINIMNNNNLPKKIEGKVLDVNLPLFSLWFLNQDVTIKTDYNCKKFFLLFSLDRRISKNKYYEFYILPKSRLIVYKKINNLKL